MSANEKPIDEQLWSMLDYIRSLGDPQYIIDLLEARRDFLRLRRRSEIEIRHVYLQAANEVSKVLKRLKSTASELTRNSLIQLERSLRREAEAIQKAVTEQVRKGIEESVKLGARPTDNQLRRAISKADVPLDMVRIEWAFLRTNTAAVEALWARTHKGLRVSDRIWRNTEKARDAMLDIIQAGIASGRDTVEVARDLERYVRSGVGTLARDYPKMMARLGKRIPKDLSYDALRLVRTERAKAYTEGTYSRGRMNPSYRGVRWMLSDAHPLYDICDILATQDLYDMGPGVYPAGSEPAIPHPNCLCTAIPIVINTDEFVQQLINWKNNPDSEPEIQKWYQTVYLGA